MRKNISFQKMKYSPNWSTKFYESYHAIMTYLMEKDQLNNN